MLDRFPSPTKETLNSKGVPSSIFELDSDVLRGTVHTNNKVRKDRDWEKMKGRAVVE